MNKLTAPQRIKRHIMASQAGQEVLSDMDFSFSPEDGQEIDHVFRELQTEWLLQDAVSEFRCSGEETDVEYVVVEYATATYAIKYFYRDFVAVHVDQNTEVELV